ncbi:MAG: hypothetical protein Q8Q02_02035 [Nocardioides sp.]|nr:hypothetical protein [Nocardioides sp.]
MPSTALRAGAVFAAIALSMTAAPALAHEGEDKSPTNLRALSVATKGEAENMSFIANLQYEAARDTNGDGTLDPVNQEGSDVEFLTAGKKEYALAGTLRKGLRIIDITDPAQPRQTAHYDCPLYQGDVQVWEKKGRAYAAYTADSAFDSGGVKASTSQCGRDLAEQFAAQGIDPARALGTVIVDISNPRKPRTVSFLPIPRGSHNMTIHPSGDYLYNSNSDLATSTSPTIEVWDVSDVRSPVKAHTLALPVMPTSLGSESHDVTFDESGDRAYSAAISQTLVLDTSDPAKPSILSQIVDPSINVSHQADPVTMTREDGSERELIVVTDELAGATSTYTCPGGGLHVYDVTGDNALDPVKVGAWFIDHVNAPESRCTSHVLRIYPEQEMLTIAWYGQGVRVLDISGLADVAASPVAVAFGDGVGMTEVGSYVMPDADTWAFKTNKIESDGSFYGYGNDMVRGFDVYHYDGTGIDREVAPLAPTSLLTDAELIDAGVVEGLGGITATDDTAELTSVSLPASGLTLGVGLIAMVGLLRLRRS